MLKNTVGVLIAVALAGSLFAFDAQAIGRGGLHEMHNSEARDSHRGGGLARNGVSSGFGRDLLHSDNEPCRPNCDRLLGCRSLWQYSCL
jgi:hypothetical protein